MRSFVLCLKGPLWEEGSGWCPRQPAGHLALKVNLDVTLARGGGSPRWVTTRCHLPALFSVVVKWRTRWPPFPGDGARTDSIQTSDATEHNNTGYSCHLWEEPVRPWKVSGTWQDLLFKRQAQAGRRGIKIGGALPLKWLGHPHRRRGGASPACRLCTGWNTAFLVSLNPLL